MVVMVIMVGLCWLWWVLIIVGSIFWGEIALMFAGKGWVVGIWLVEKLSSEQVPTEIYYPWSRSLRNNMFGDLCEILSGLLKFRLLLLHSSILTPLFSSCWRDWPARARGSPSSPGSWSRRSSLTMRMALPPPILRCRLICFDRRHFFLVLTFLKIYFILRYPGDRELPPG